MESSLLKYQNTEVSKEEDSEELEEISDDDTENEINVTSMDKNTNLHFSASLGITDTFFQDLESPDQKIDAENFMGWTPLMMAVRNGHIDIVNALLEKGADVTKKNRFGMNIFSMSIASGKQEMMEIVLRHMLRGGISRNKIQDNISPLSLAILFNRPQQLNWIIDQGFDLNAPTRNTKLSPLMFAVVTKSEPAIKLLETRGANKNHKNYMGLNYGEIMLWKSVGLQNVKKGNVIEQGTKIISEGNIPIILTTSPNSNTKSKGNVSRKSATRQKKIDVEQIPSEVELRVPNNTPFSKPTVQEVPKRKSKLLNIQLPQLTNINTTLPLKQSQFQSQHPSENSVEEVVQSDLQQSDLNLPSCSSDDLSTKTSYQTSSNTPYSSYITVMNPQYGIPNMGSPATPLTPIMLVPQYQNFVTTVANLPQNSPMNLMPSPHNIYHNAVASPQIYFSPQIPQDMGHHNFDGPNSYNGFYNNSVFYQFFSHARNVNQ